MHGLLVPCMLHMGLHPMFDHFRLSPLTLDLLTCKQEGEGLAPRATGIRPALVLRRWVGVCVYVYVCLAREWCKEFGG